MWEIYSSLRIRRQIWDSIFCSFAILKKPKKADFFGMPLTRKTYLFFPENLIWCCSFHKPAIALGENMRFFVFYFLGAFYDSQRFFLLRKWRTFAPSVFGVVSIVKPIAPSYSTWKNTSKTCITLFEMIFSSPPKIH